MTKYFWIGNEVGVSDDFDSFVDCENDAANNYKEFPFEHNIYCYDTEEFPNGPEQLDDCEYLGFIGNNE